MVRAFILLIFLFTSACNTPAKTETETKENEHNIEIGETEESEQEEQKEIVRHEGDPSPVLDQVFTTDPVIAVTMNGLIADEKMHTILHKLAEYDLNISFFVDQDQLENQSEMVQTISEQGHIIETSVYKQEDLSDVDYEGIYNNVAMTNDMIQNLTGHKPNFTRTKPWKEDHDLQLITAQLNMEAVVGHSIRPRDSDLKDQEALARYFERALSRGGIISLDTKDYPQILDSIDYIVEEASQIEYAIIPLADLVDTGQTRKPFEEIEGHDLIKKNLDYENEEPNVFYSKATNEKVVALTFDDYGSDKTVLEILDILDSNNIQSTFFLKAKNVERNPNLAKVILDRGHEVANHSYAHLKSTELTPEELQEDLIKAHQVITEAIQEKPAMLFRPPFGNVDDRSEKVMSAVGFQNIAMYDISSYDWNADYTVYDVLNRVMDNVNPGSVIVMHLSDDIKNIDTLPIIIEELESEGYYFTKMSDWFEEE